MQRRAKAREEVYILVKDGQFPSWGLFVQLEAPMEDIIAMYYHKVMKGAARALPARQVLWSGRHQKALGLIQRHRHPSAPGRGPMVPR